MRLKTFFQSLKLKTILGIIAGVLGVLLIFEAGMIVGFQKAQFSCKWGENYHQNFGGPRNKMLEGLDDRTLMNPHGAFGEIIKIDGQTLVMENPNHVEKIVQIKPNTVIKEFQDTVESSSLKVGDNIVVIGTPNEQGQIEARFIRLLPLSSLLQNEDEPF